MPVNRADPCPKICCRTFECTPICADDVARHMPAIGQMQHNAIIRLLEPDTPIPHLNRIRRSRPHRIQQNPIKIPAMDHPVRRTETFDRGLPQIERLPTLPGASQPHFLAGRGANDLLHGRFQPQRNQQPRSVRTELHPGPDLPQLEACSNSRT